MKKLISSLVVVGAMIASPVFAQSATVSLNVEIYAVISDLEDFVLTTNSSGGAGAVYSGAGQYHLESNGQIRVSLSGDDLSNGLDSIPTSYDLYTNGPVGTTPNVVYEVDGSYVTPIDEVHSADHSVSAEAILGDISAHKAGTYSSVITLTVTPVL